jgi:hypothetical protein
VSVSLLFGVLQENAMMTEDDEGGHRERERERERERDTDTHTQKNKRMTKTMKESH